MKTKLLLLISFILIVSCSADPNEEILIARSNIKSGAYETARFHINRILEQDSTVSEALFLLGRIENHLENYTEAKTYLDKAIKSNPKSAEAYKERIFSNKKLGLDKEVIMDLSDLIAMYPDDGSNYLERANFYLIMNLLDDACQDWLKAAELGEGEANRIYEKFCTKPVFE